jgi:hypothetical protein
MNKFVLPLLLLTGLALVACLPESSVGGPPTPAEAIIVTEPAAEILADGTTIDLRESPTRKLTGELEPDGTLSYTLVMAAEAAANLAVLEPSEGVTFSLTAPDEVTLEGEVTDVVSLTATVPAEGEYTLTITNGTDETVAFLMDVQIDLGLESTAP